MSCRSTTEVKTGSKDRDYFINTVLKLHNILDLNFLW